MKEITKTHANKDSLVNTHKNNYHNKNLASLITLDNEDNKLIENNVVKENTCMQDIII